MACRAVALRFWPALWQFLPRGADPPAPRVYALTSYPGVEATPTLSPDGKQVAFSWDGENGDNEDIYVVIVGSDSPLRLHKDAARDVSPAWKPDGSQIAFARLDGRRAAIYVVRRSATRNRSSLSSRPSVAGAPIGSQRPVLVLVS